MKKAISWGSGIIAGLCIILVLLITSFEIVTYSSIRFYKYEYQKHNVLQAVNMEMDDILEVTNQMMAYLCGNREDLVVNTVVGGEEREFFNDQEKSHMADVRNLFLDGLLLRKIALASAAFFIVLVILLKKKKWKYVLAKAFQISTIVFFVISFILGMFIAMDFNNTFVIFHKIFFTNDLWLFDPSTSLMINMLPEGFFFDTVTAIGIVFFSFLFLLLIVSFILGRFFKEDDSIKIFKIESIV